MRVVVIGAGAVGANIAFRLVQDGQDVTVLDAGRPGRGTTGTSISWLSSFPQAAAADSGELGMRLSINRAFAELEAEIGGAWMHWADTLTWATEPAAAARLRADWKVSSDRGVAVDLLAGREARAREPALAIADGAEVYAEHGGGWVDAPLLVETLLAAAVQRGATVLEQTRAAGIERDAGHVTAVTTDRGLRIPADLIVNAAGSWASHIGALAGCPVPLDLRPGLVVYSQPFPGGSLRHVLNTPMLNIRPDPGGGVAVHCRAESLYGHHGRNALDPADVISLAARWLPALAGSTPRAARVGIRPVPPGGPIIGPHPSLAGMYVAVSHGGVGWGPLWGTFAASEITGNPVAALSRWRPDRFIAGSADLTEGEI
jgi:glycine/D-amino acid oxidase-like deaminating enzyme